MSFEQNWPDISNLDPNPSKFGRARQYFRRVRPNVDGEFTSVVQHYGGLGQNWPKFDRVCQDFGQFRP